MNDQKMSHHTLSRLLIGAGIVVIPVWAVVFFVLLPVAAEECIQMYPDYARLYVPGLIWGETFGALLLACLVLYLRISVRIGRNETFCMKNVKALKWIAWMIGICALLPLCVPLALGDVLVSMYAFGLFLLLGAAAILIYCISRLLASAVALREENDLTI